ncbi:hypothetical protein AMJ51_02125 [Microgenomates bacterium DG_75]|nr:MAG: hypothetical protein AMJ51_02125 [Microgenomates bacterium DG_75]
MADPNEDRPFNDQPSSGPDSEPKLRPPWQVVEEVEPEKTEEEAGPPPPTEPVPTEEEVKKEEIDLTGALEEEAPATEEVPVPETKMPPMEAALEEGPPEEMPPGEAPPEAPPIDAVRPLEEEAPPLEEAPTVEPPTPAPSGPLRAFHIETKSPLGPIKKLLPIILGLVLVVGLVLLFIQVGLPRLRLGVPSLPIPGGREVTLTYWGLWEPELVMKEIIADWNKDYPKIKVNYSMQSKQQYRERIQSALARGEGPDIFRYHVTWVPMLKSQLDSLPTEVMSASEFGVTYYPVASTNLRSGASYLGIPLGIDTLALLYNKDIFQTAGEAPPATWDELRNLAVELTTYDEAGRIQTAGVALGTTNNVEHWSDILGLMMLQNEADLTNPVGALAEDALEYYTIFNRKDRVWDQTLPNSTLAFANGKLAMYFGYSWDVFEIKKINPDLNFGIVKAPQVPGTQNISWASFWVEGVNNKSERDPS